MATEPETSIWSAPKPLQTFSTWGNLVKLVLFVLFWVVSYFNKKPPEYAVYALVAIIMLVVIVGTYIKRIADGVSGEVNQALNEVDNEPLSDKIKGHISKLQTFLKWSLITSTALLILICGWFIWDGIHRLWVTKVPASLEIVSAEPFQKAKADERIG